jgi:hypothetical protein
MSERATEVECAGKGTGRYRGGRSRRQRSVHHGKTNRVKGPAQTESGRHSRRRVGRRVRLHDHLRTEVGNQTHRALMLGAGYRWVRGAWRKEGVGAVAYGQPPISDRWGIL